MLLKQRYTLYKRQQLTPQLSLFNERIKFSINRPRLLAHSVSENITLKTGIIQRHT
jgi:hypothetical protein